MYMSNCVTSFHQFSGLPISSQEDSTREVVIEVTSRGRGPANRRPSENDHGTMKRLASGRLHQEMIREKQREVGQGWVDKKLGFVVKYFYNVLNKMDPTCV